MPPLQVHRIELGPVGGVGVRVVEAFAGGRVDQFPVARLPLLVGAAVAVPQLDEGAVVVVGAGDVQALAVDLQGAVGATVHCWLTPPVQSHIWILLPLAVEKALSSTHLELLTPETIGPVAPAADEP